MNKLTFSRHAVALSYPHMTIFQIQTQISCADCSFITYSLHKVHLMEEIISL